MRVLASLLLCLTLAPAASAQELDEIIDEVCLGGSGIGDPFAGIDELLGEFTMLIEGYSEKNCSKACKALGKFCSSYVKKTVSKCVDTVLSFTQGFGKVVCAEEAGPFAKECQRDLKDIVKIEKSYWKGESRFAAEVCKFVQSECTSTCL